MYTYMIIWKQIQYSSQIFFFGIWHDTKCAGTLPLNSRLESIFQITGGAKWRRQHQMVQVFEVVAIRHLAHIHCGRKGEVKGWVPTRRLKVLGICYAILAAAMQNGSPLVSQAIHVVAPWTNPRPLLLLHNEPTDAYINKSNHCQESAEKKDLQ